MSVSRHVIQGQSVKDLISTSYVEKQNHTLRMHCRRLSRLTNAFSKKIENFKEAVSLHCACYNFVKTHSAIRCTPAVEAGVENSAWTVADLVAKIEGMSERIQRLRKAVEAAHDCNARHEASEPIRETWKGKQCARAW